MNSVFETLSRIASRMNAIRQVPEGLCKHCAGTGAGEALADLGESFSRGGQLPVKECKSCSGTGMAIAKVEVTAKGLLLLFPVAAAIYQNRQRRIARPIVAPPNVVTTPTTELLSLMDALHSNAPTVQPRESELTASTSVKRSTR